ncbi:kinase-like protein [Basidiobolus meristosporus CBS 931.73]|uniref:non-specific serine/threonine protein kinase n=1 Tax=Basidiobolus meristosporus CBS 931.73 TaxID=1314790 RepID=A0A1Y1XTP3_9FUNG|nr:kinase-like protein [Basidiobolus meristosporus CBS 931.73]|eukprot:ORX89131.1 kinase-like protein [Basidiobolus meristosporus CBS 931.73]
MSSISTYTSVDSQNSGITDLQIPERFLFSAVKEKKSKKSFNFPNLLKVRSRSSKKKIVEQLPLLDALRKRNLPTLAELYGSFSDNMGNGASGNVRATFSLRDGKKYAVKTYRAKHEGQKKKQYFERISSEIYIGASLSHRNIIRTIDVIMEEGKIHQIMEFCPNDLITIVQGGLASAEQLDQYFLQMMEGLRYLHHRGVAHRDVKLENLCVNEEGVLKIIDFGSSFIVTNPFDLFQTKSATSFVGTDPYIAPEIQDRKAYDATKADIWSAGVVYVVMVLKRFPWKAALPSEKSYTSFLQNRDQDEFFRLLPAGSIPLIRQMLDPNPDTRATIDEVFNDSWLQSLRTPSSLDT